MADTKISDLTAVTTPASTDEFAVNQGGVSKKETRAQLHTLESGERILLDDGTALIPALSWKDDTNLGFLRSGNDIIRISHSGAVKWQISGVDIKGLSSGAGVLRNEVASATNPVHVFGADGDSGAGLAELDAPSQIAGGVEAQRWTEVSSAVLTAVQGDVGLTAHTDSVQGAGVILSSYNVYSTVGTTGDAATLPAVFTIDPSTLVYVKNDGANSMDVFPASGDDAGAGADTAVAVAAGDFAVFMATAANSTWTKIMGGTA